MKEQNIQKVWFIENQTFCIFFCVETHIGAFYYEDSMPYFYLGENKRKKEEHRNGCIN